MKRILLSLTIAVIALFTACSDKRIDLAYAAYRANQLQEIEASQLTEDDCKNDIQLFELAVKEFGINGKSAVEFTRHNREAFETGNFTDRQRQQQEQIADKADLLDNVMRILCNRLENQTVNPAIAEKAGKLWAEYQKIAEETRQEILRALK